MLCLEQVRIPFAAREAQAEVGRNTWNWRSTSPSSDVTSFGYGYTVKCNWVCHGLGAGNETTSGGRNEGSVWVMYTCHAGLAYTLLPQLSDTCMYNLQAAAAKSRRRAKKALLAEKVWQGSAERAP